MYDQLIQFHKKFDHRNVRRDSQAYSKLVKWSDLQRKKYKRGLLSQHEIEQRELLGFAWDLWSDLWGTRLEELKQFKHDFGHCGVPNGWQKNPRLSSWVKWQRHNYISGEIPKNRIEKLNALGFKWQFPTVNRELVDKRMYTELLQFHHIFGHCNVPLSYPKNVSLGHWVSLQRRKYTSKTLANNIMKKLNEIDFTWNVYQDAQERGYQALKEYVGKVGHCNVQKNEETKSLYNWVVKQRVKYKQGKLDKQFVKRLDALGFKW